jgi:hypothetical protein
MNKDKNENPSQDTALVLDQKAIAGVTKYFASVTKVTLLGTDYTPAALTAKLQSEIDALNALASGKAQMKQQVATTREVRKIMRAFRAALRKYILGAYGPTAVQMLEDFGMKAPKNTGPKTAEAKAVAAAKSAATKKAKKDALAKLASSSPAAPAATVSTTPSK